MGRGRLIVIEGLDRSGKSTQCSLLCSSTTIFPTSSPARLFKFPDRTTPTGLLINSYLTDPTVTLDDHAIHLLFSANRWDLKSLIERTLRDGVNVVCDRYTLSGLAFSVVKGLPQDWCASCDRGLPRPDLTVFLDLDEGVAKQRGGYGEERYETVEIQRRVRDVFKKLILRDERCVVVDADDTVEGLSRRIAEIVQGVMDRDVGELEYIT